MSPQEAGRLVGHPDIVERIKDDVQLLHRPLHWDGGNSRVQRTLLDSLHELERLRTALRAVRASTDPKWQAQIISDALRETP